MAGASILDRTQRVVADVAGVTRTPPDAGPDTPLGDGGFWLDSVDLMEVIVACESEFGVILDADLTPHTLSTARNLAALIEARGGR